MTHTYNITGMTCKGCVAKAKSELLKLGDIVAADVQLAQPQATITMQQHISAAALQAALNKAGNYTITQVNASVKHHTAAEKTSWLNTYKPVLLIGAFITGISLLSEAAQGSFLPHRWMSHFMAGFFLTFSFFKLLDLKSFAESYATYDIVAKKWTGWGYVYAFVELLLGVAYLVHINPVFTNTIAFAIMSISIVGVLQSVLNKRTIQCACLGTVFNLPMSTVTIIEDATMIVMSAAMLLSIV